MLPAGAPVFLDTPPKPDRKRRAGGARRLSRAGGCDGIVALGGGSPIDLAKGVALLATHDGAARAVRGHLWRARADQPRKVAPVDRHPDHGGHRRGGWPRRRC